MLWIALNSQQETFSKSVEPYRLFALSRKAFVVRSIDFAMTRVLADILGLASFNGLKLRVAEMILLYVDGRFRIRTLKQLIVASIERASLFSQYWTRVLRIEAIPSIHLIYIQHAV
jgi:hypothetical protein